MCAFAVPADANVMVTCRRLSNDEPEVIEINRDDSDNSAVIITTPTTKGLILRGYFYNDMRYINLRFTYLLTYLLT